MNSHIARIVFKVSFVLLGIVLAVLIITPIAAPVSDTYLAAFGWTASVLMIISAVSWFIGRK